MKSNLRKATLLLTTLGCLVYSTSSFATNNTVPAPAPTYIVPQQQQNADSTANSQSLQQSQDSYRNSMYVLPGGYSPTAPAIPPGVCNFGNTRSIHIAFGLLSLYDSNTNMDEARYLNCIREVLDHAKAAPVLLAPTTVIHPTHTNRHLQSKQKAVHKRKKASTLQDCTEVLRCLPKEYK